MSVFRNLYRGETRFPFISTRKWWYAASFVILLVCLFCFVFRGFNYGVEFAGGSQFQIPATNSAITTDKVNTAFSHSEKPAEEPPQEVGTGANRQIVVKTESLTSTETLSVKDSVAKTLKIDPATITVQTVSSSWGHDVTMKAIQGLIVFLIVVSIYISIRFQWRMAVGGILALFHDLILTAGVYSLVGFEVTPSTIVGLLTILGFSLYDTVVVYDKVEENAKNILAGSRTTYSEAANLAVNQTLMRSINTSLISLLPVAGLLFVGVGLLGVGTLEDLALILFVGLATGAYSSLFLATPIVVDLTEREPAYKALTRRVEAKRASDAKKLADAELAVAGAGAVSASAARVLRGSGGGAPPPKPGAKPQRRRK